MHKRLIIFQFLRRSFTIAFILLAIGSIAQEDYKDEDDLKKGAEELFEQKKFTQAAPLFSQLVSLYPKDPNYNYKYGACLIEFSPDPEEALSYLKFAISRPDADPEAYFYLGKAYHINYSFNAAIENFERFKKLAKSKVIKELNPDREIQNCKNGLELLRNLTDIVVYENNNVGLEDFFRSYQLDGFGGKLIVKPEDFQSDYEKKNDISTVLFLPDSSSTIYFSYIEGKGENGRDIFYATKDDEGVWGEPQKFEGPINTELDEDYAFMHPNGREFYFSSKGHNSMGGYDIFRSFRDPSSGEWSEPINIDFAINTPYDDFLFIKNKADDRAYFSSNRFAKGGKVNVYKIAMQRVPLDFTAIQGTFTSPNGYKANITVEDMYSNTTVGTFETSADGAYAFKLPSSGKFRFLVEQTASNITHAGVVELKNEETFTPLSQKMEIINEEGEEKLIITNLLGEEPEEDGLPLAAQLIKEQAKLEVNYDKKEPQLIAEVEKKEKGPQLIIPDQPSSNSTSFNDNQKETTKDEVVEELAQNPEEKQSSDLDFSAMSVSELAAIGNDLVASYTEQSNTFTNKANAAEEKNQQVQTSLTSKQQQLEQLREGKNEEELKNDQVFQSLQNEVLELEIEAAAAVKLKEYYTNKSEEKRTSRDVVDMQAQSLNGAVANNATKQEIDNVEDIVETLSISSEASRQNESLAAESFSDLLTNYNDNQSFIENQQGIISAQQSVVDEATQNLENLKAQRDSETKKKNIKKLTQEIEGTERSLDSKKNELKKAKQELENAFFQQEVIKAQLEQANEIAKNNEPGVSENQIDESFAKQLLKSNISPTEITNDQGVLLAYNELTTQSPQLELADNEPIPSSETATDQAQTEISNNETGESIETADFTKNVTDNASSEFESNPKESENAIEPKAEIAPGLQTAVSDFNYESNYNEEFFLPVPNGAELPLTASTDNAPTSIIPDPVDETTLPIDNEFSESFTSRLAEANSIEDEIVRDNTKGDLLNSWASKLDTEIFLLKEKRRKTGNEKKKAELSQEIEALELQKQEVENAADQSFKRVSLKRNEELLTGEAAGDVVLQKQIEYQSLNNVAKSSYNKEYSKEFTNIGEIQNDYLRLYKTKDLNERWVEDLSKEIDDLTAISASDTDPKRKMIVEERIASLSKLKGLKEGEIENANGMIVQYAFQNPSDPNADGGTGITKKKADALASQSQNLMVNSIMLSDSASKVSDPELKSQLIKQANSDYVKSKELAEEASNIYIALNNVMTAQSTSVNFNNESELKSADYEEIAKAQAAKSNNPTPSNSNNESGLPTSNFVVSPGSFTGPALAGVAASQLSENAQNKVKTLDATIENLSNQAAQETDPAKKIALETEVKSLQKQRKMAQAEVNVQKRSAATLAKAENNAQTDPSANSQLAADISSEAQTLQATIEDSIAYAQTLRTSADNATNTEDRLRFLKEAETVEANMQAKQQEVEGLLALATEVQRVQKIAEVKQKMPATISNFNFPTSNKVLTEAEVKEVASTLEWEQFQGLKADYQRSLKEAEIMFKNAAATREDGERDLKEATVLRGKAAQATDAEERKRLLKEAEVLEKSGKAKLKESTNMEFAASELGENAVTKKKEIEIFVAKLDPALAAMVVAYDAGQTSNSEAGVIASAGQPTVSTSQETPNQETSNQETPNQATNSVQASSSTSNNSTQTQKPSSSQFYAGKAANNLNVTYDPNTRAVFKIGDENTAYYNEAQPIQFNPELPSGLVYKVQIGAFSKRIAPENFRGFAPITAENAGNGILRYTAGLFEVFNSADVAKNEIRKLGYNDAFVVAYYNGKRVSVADARDMRRFAGAQPAKLGNYAVGAASTGSASTAAVSSALSSGNPGAEPNSLPNTTPRVTPVAEIGPSVNPVLTNMQNLEGTFYTVQVGVFSKPVNPSALKNITPLQLLKTANGFYKYNSGVFDNIQDAVAAKNKIVQQGITDAFVTAYANQQRVTPQEAQQKLNTGSSNLSSSPVTSAPTAENTTSNQPIGSNVNTQANSSQAPLRATFRVQVGAYEKDIPVNQAKAILGLTKYGVDIDETQQGLTKYLVGSFGNYDAANNFKAEMVKIGLTDAFVVAIQNGKRIDTEKARELNGN